MTTPSSFAVDDFCARGIVTNEDVARLRRLLLTETEIRSDEAAALIELNGLCAQHEPAWRDFYLEALSEHLVDDVAPHGYLTTRNAVWLIEQIAKDGLVANKLDIELLVALLARARWSPEVLVRLALVQVLHAVRTGRGPLRSGGTPGPGDIAESDVELLRRIVYAFGGESGFPVTRAEAEILFAINDSLHEPLTTAWAEFFVKAIANAVLAGSGYEVPTREEALRPGMSLPPDAELTVVTLLGALDPTALRSIYRPLSSEDAALARLERQRVEIITNAEVTQGEVSWLAERLGRAQPLTATEELLVAALAREGLPLHPSLDSVVARLRTAA